MLFYPFTFEYKNIPINGVISFLLVAIPRNLEIAHLVLNKELIETNFEKFSDLLLRISTYVDYRKLFLD